MTTIDARGLSCPEPLMMASDAIKSNGDETIVVLVDSASARDNIERHAHSKKKNVAIQSVDGYYEIRIS